MNTGNPLHAWSTPHHKSSQYTALYGVVMRLGCFSAMRSQFSPDSAAASLGDHGHCGHLVLPSTSG